MTVFMYVVAVVGLLINTVGVIVLYNQGLRRFMSIYGLIYWIVLCLMYATSLVWVGANL